MNNLIENRQDCMKRAFVVTAIFLLLATSGNWFAQTVVPSGVPRPRARNVAILIFDGVQVIDFTGPYEVFGRPGVRVFTVAEKADSITTNGRLTVTPAFTFANSPEPDVIVVPGGGIHEEEQNPVILSWLREKSKNAQIVMSVCNGAFLLAAVGLLDNIEATTTTPMVLELQQAAPKAKVISGKRFVDAGKVITATGLSAGIDAALHVIERLDGKARARETAITMEYNWDWRNVNPRASLADLHLGNVIDAVFHPRLGAKTVVFEGSDRQWKCVYEVAIGDEPEKFIQQIDEHLATVDKWQKTDGNNLNNESSSKWRFTAKNNQRWKGEVNVKKNLSDPQKLLIAFKVTRTD